MAACNEEDRRRKNYGKELPPITLSNTSVSGLVTLIPVLVSLTSQLQNPRFDDENDKPIWWPPDIQWQNPKSYSTYMGPNILNILRQVVHSCYSYHGVADLLCRLDEVPFIDLDEDDNLDAIIDISDSNFIDEQGPASCSSSSDSLVFVCCFCLEQFGSHGEVTSHQNQCHLRSTVHSADTEANHKKETSGHRESAAVNAASNASSKSGASSPYPVSLHSSYSIANNDHLPAGRQRSALTKGPLSNSTSSSAVTSSKYSNNKTMAMTNSSKRQQPPSLKFVPILKTRSQKKLDQIMERHSSRKLMLSECKRIKGMAEKGAWWGRKLRRKKIAMSPHPSCTRAKEPFLSNLGLTLKVKADAQTEKEDLPKASVDLDCEIILVEGPLSRESPKQDNSYPLSPRGSRSLMSQLSRDSEICTRRRLSFCFVEDEWADKEALEEGRDPLQMSLLSIGLSSPLGQRIKKYAKGNGPLNIIKDPEMYCKTEYRDDSTSRLRYRTSDYRVTYRKKCRASTYVHYYKFNRSDVEEFKTRLKTGLSSRSRHLRHTMKPLQVVMSRMSADAIKRWTEEKKVSITENIIYDDDICLTQIEIPRSKIKGYLTPSSAAMVSQHPTPHSQQSMSHHHHRHPSNHHTKGLGKKFNHLPSQKSNSGLTPSPYLNHSSPPYVPNIFRNRNSHSASPPSRSPGKFGHAQRAWHKTSPTLDGRPAQHQKNKNMPSVSNSKAQPQSHNSNRMPPFAGFSSGILITERRPLNPNANSSRRKQVLDQVRQDEHEVKSLTKGPSSTQLPRRSPHLVEVGGGRKNKQKSKSANARNGSFIHLSSHSDSLSKTNPSYSSSPSSFSSPSSSFSSPFSSLMPLPSAHAKNNKTQHSEPHVPKLSNFEYLSIKQGLLSSGHSLSDDSMRAKYSSSSRQNPTISDSSLHSSESSPGCRSSAIPSAQNHSKALSATSNQQHNENRNSGFFMSAKSSVSQRIPIHRNENPSASRQSGMRLSVPFDDDILEVICIDD